MKAKQFDEEVLVLQGGGALGAYHAGVYEALAEAGHTPTWVVGVSVGAITSALIAGNPPELRAERLRAFWDRVSGYAPVQWPAWLNPFRATLNSLSSATVATFGCPGFFSPRIISPFIASPANSTPSFYDTSALKKTLEELVDFDLLNNGSVRVSLGAVNVRTGESKYFDSQTTRIGPEHVMASGSLPPGFPSVEIDGEHYWDGGIVSNSPLTYVVDQRPQTKVLIIQVDLFNASGELPRTIDAVLERQKDIQYASKQRFNTERVQERGELWGALRNLLDKLPDNLKKDPDTLKLATIVDNREWTIVRLTNQRLPYVSQTKDYEFSRATVNEHWSAGMEDVRRTVINREWLQPTELGPGVRLYDTTGGNNK